MDNMDALYNLKQLGNYRLLRLLEVEDRGVHGRAVYQGEDVSSKTQVLIKCPSDLGTTVDLPEDFRSDMEGLVRLEHPHILRVLDCGIEGDLPFVVFLPSADLLPRIKGTLYQRHFRDQFVAPTTVLSYAQQIGTALQYAHDHGVRSFQAFEPANLLYTRDDTILVCSGVDFFHYCLYSEPFIYDPAKNEYYAAPETFFQKAQQASDQYRLAAIVYQWLCGYLPFTDNGPRTWEAQDESKKGTHIIPSGRRVSSWDIVDYIVWGSPLSMPADRIPPALEMVIMIALAKEPKHRFASVDAFVHALEQTILEKKYRR